MYHTDYIQPIATGTYQPLSTIIMNTYLRSLYYSKTADFKQVVENLPKDAFGPHLMNPGTEYQSSSIKLLRVGQDTNRWSQHHDNVDAQMMTYSDFYAKHTEGSRPFWNVTNKLEDAIGNNRLSCAWTNINKFDIGGKRPTGPYADVIKSLDHILVDEIRILSPNICVFFTGPAFDDRLRSIFPKIEFVSVGGGFEDRQLCKLIDHDGVLPKHTFRTYHPRYLRMKKLENQVIEYIRRTTQA